MGASFSNRKRTNMDNKNTRDEQDNTRSNVRPLSIEAGRHNTGNHPHEVLPNQPRQPRNMQGLLRFAMEATEAENTSHTTHNQPLDEERKKFLNDALSSLSVNIVEELQKDVQFLKNVVELREDDDPSEYEAALERISEYSDNMDIANDFYKIGGFSILGPCLNSQHSGIRWKVADLIAELTQNNPFCQGKILQAGFLPILLMMVDSDTSEHARVKSLYAVSCIARGHNEALVHMQKHDGFSVLVRALQSSVEKLQIKSAFLLSALCSKDNNDGLKSDLVKMGVTEQIAGLLIIPSLTQETKEQLLHVLNNLSSNNYWPALREFRRPELCLKLTLERLLEEAKKEQNIDMEDLCKEILQEAFANEETEVQER